MTLEFQQYAVIVQEMRAIAANANEVAAVRQAARDIVMVLERDRDTLAQRLLAIATDSQRTDAARVRAMELLLTLL